VLQQQQQQQEEEECGPDHQLQQQQQQQHGEEAAGEGGGSAVGRGGSVDASVLASVLGVPLAGVEEGAGASGGVKGFSVADLVYNIQD
jgi:hypothetical protein